MQRVIVVRLCNAFWDVRHLKTRGVVTCVLHTERFLYV
jgi:hypothetical protein